MRVRIGAAFHDPQHLRAEGGDRRPGIRRGLHVLDHVVEQGGDRLVLAGPVVEGDGARPQQVAEVRDVAPLPALAGVQPRRHAQGIDEPLRVEGRIGHGSPQQRTFASNPLYRYCASATPPPVKPSPAHRACAPFSVLAPATQVGCPAKANVPPVMSSHMNGAE